METLGILIVAAILLVVLVFRLVLPVRLFLTAWSSGVRISIMDLLAMRLRRIPPDAIVNPLISARAAQVEVKRESLEALFLAGGNPGRVVEALVLASRNGLDLSFTQASALDLAERDVLEAVRAAAKPRVLETVTVTAKAKDDVQLSVETRMTVRTDLEELIGGADEKTLLARIRKAVISAVRSQDHTRFLDDPDEISRAVLENDLDSGTRFQIVEIESSCEVSAEPADKFGWDFA